MRLNSLFTILSGLIILSISIGVIYGTFTLQQINRKTQIFVNTTMLGLFADWNNSEFLIHASDELQQNLTIEQLDKINSVFTQLGKLLNYHGAQGGVFRSTTSLWSVNARYKVHASFQGGQFTAIISLVEQQGKWVIGRFDYQYAFS